MAEPTAEEKVALRTRAAMMVKRIKERTELKITGGAAQHWIGTPFPDDEMFPHDVRYICRVATQFTDRALRIHLMWGSIPTASKPPTMRLISLEKYDGDGVGLGYVSKNRCRQLIGLDDLPIESVELPETGPGAYNMLIDCEEIDPFASIYRLVVEFTDGDKIGMLIKNEAVRYELGNLYARAHIECEKKKKATAAAASTIITDDMKRALEIVVGTISDSRARAQVPAPAPAAPENKINADVRWISDADFKGYRITCKMATRHVAGYTPADDGTFDWVANSILTDLLHGTGSIHSKVAFVVGDHVYVMFEWPRATREGYYEYTITIRGVLEAFSH